MALEIDLRVSRNGTEENMMGVGDVYDKSFAKVLYVSKLKCRGSRYVYQDSMVK